MWVPPSETDQLCPEQLFFPLVSRCIQITSSTSRVKRWNPICLFLHFHYLKWKLQQLFYRCFVHIFFLMLLRIFGMRSRFYFRAGCIKAKASIYFRFFLLTINLLTFWVHEHFTRFLQLWLHLRSEQRPQNCIWSEHSWKPFISARPYLTFTRYSYTIKIAKWVLQVKTYLLR